MGGGGGTSGIATASTSFLGYYTFCYPSFWGYGSISTIKGGGGGGGGKAIGKGFAVEDIVAPVMVIFCLQFTTAGRGLNANA